MQHHSVHQESGVLMGIDPRTGIGFGHTFSRDEKGEQYKSPSDLELDLRANAGILLTALHGISKKALNIMASQDSSLR